MQVLFENPFRGREVALPWNAQLEDFWRGTLRGGTEGMERSTFGPWWQEAQLPTAGWFTDITLRACAGISPNRPGSADGSIFEQLPAKSP